MISRSVRFHHIGLAVRDFGIARKFLQALGYVCSEPVTDEHQNVEIIMCDSTTSPSVELVRPIDDESPVSKLLARQDAVLYHICLETDSVEGLVEGLRNDFRVVTVKGPAAAVLFGGRSVSFYYIKGVGLVEILEQ